jgi:hypothetical protein
MKRLSVLFILLFFVKISAQEKFSLGVIGGPALYYYEFWGFPDSMYLDGDVAPFPPGDHKFFQKINYNVGLITKYKISQKMECGLNVLYSTKGYGVDYNVNYNLLNDSIIYLVFDKSILNFNYIDINPIVGYKWEYKNILFIPQIGFSFGRLIHSMSKSYFISPKERKIKFIQYDYKYTDEVLRHEPAKNVMNLSLSLETRIKLKSNLEIFSNFCIAQYLNQVTPVPMKTYPASTNINFGILLTINNNNHENK